MNDGKIENKAIFVRYLPFDIEIQYFIRENIKTP